MSQLRVDSITNEIGTGSPSLPNGLIVGDINYPATGPLSNRNKIINGAMVIDQRNAGAAVTVNSTTVQYPVDRFLGRGQNSDGVFTLQPDASAPAGFTKSIKATVTTADASIGADQWYAIQQRVEGNNIADLGWGTASAKAVTLSFWVRSSLTGTFGGFLWNASFNRGYVFNYSVSVADTWEQKTVTISGDTTGTWGVENGVGLTLGWSLGAGTNYETSAGSWGATVRAQSSGNTNLIATSGATFYITGVQLEAGDTATPFEHRSYGQELALCQRYFCKTYNIDTVPGAGSSLGFSGALRTTSIATTSYMSFGNWRFPVSMRVNPTIITYNPRTGVTNGFTGDSNDFSGVAASAIGQSGVEVRVGGPQSIGTDVFISVAATASAEL